MDFFDYKKMQALLGGGGAEPEPLNITANGTYAEEGKAYNPVVVNVPPKTEEVLTKTLNMASGNMVITPTVPGEVISQVTVNKPSTLIAKNIRNSIAIGGVTGTMVEANGDDVTFEDLSANISADAQQISFLSLVATQLYNQNHSLLDLLEDLTPESLEFAGVFIPVTEASAFLSYSGQQNKVITINSDSSAVAVLDKGNYLSWEFTVVGEDVYITFTSTLNFKAGNYKLRLVRPRTLEPYNPRTYLYYKGNEFTELTGGWNYSGDATRVTFKKNSDHMYIKGEKGGPNYSKFIVKTAKHINYTGFNKLKFSLKEIESSENFRIGLNLTDNYSTMDSGSTRWYGSTENIYEFNISSRTYDFYCGITSQYVITTGYVKYIIDKVWLE